jgi:hypothetical protein
MNGGNLKSEAIFKKIISLGYEFETNEISKFSLHKNKRTLINSNIAPRILPVKEMKGSIRRVDDNYISVRIPIGVDIAKIEEEYAPGQTPEDLDEEEREVYAANRSLEKWEKKENESYLDYFYEYRKSDNHNSIEFQITNDIGETPFSSMAKSFCEDVDKDKNDMFFFKTNAGKMLDLKFSEELSSKDKCQTFSGVEFVITYFNPKKDNANVIEDTFIDALSRIVDHFGNLDPIEGTLFIDEGKKSKQSLTTIGYLDKNRNLYHKKDTNLYYMQTYDSFETQDENDKLKLETISDAVFIPQMTFKSKAADCIDIMKELMRPSSKYKIDKGTISAQKEKFQTLELTEKITNDLFAKYTEVSKNDIDFSTGKGKILKTYVFLILYKLFMFFEGHITILDETDYLKDHLSFNSRHGNYELYERIKEIFEDEYGLSGELEVQSLFENTEIMAPYFIKELKEGKDKFKDDYDEDGNYIYGEDFYTKELPEEDENYGNPLYSVVSYFRYFETNGVDWFKENDYDVFSTSFSLDNDEILIENRWFRYSISLYLRNVVDPKLPDLLRVKDMMKVVNKIYPIEKIRKMNTFEFDPYKKKLSRKCGAGYYRNMDFVCTLTKKAKQDRRTRKKKSESKPGSKPGSKKTSSKTEKK